MLKFGPHCRVRIDTPYLEVHNGRVGTIIRGEAARSDGAEEEYLVQVDGKHAPVWFEVDELRLEP